MAAQGVFDAETNHAADRASMTRTTMRESPRHHDSSDVTDRPVGRRTLRCRTARHRPDLRQPATRRADTDAAETDLAEIGTILGGRYRLPGLLRPGGSGPRYRGHAILLHSSASAASP